MRKSTARIDLTVTARDEEGKEQKVLMKSQLWFVSA